MGTRSGRRAAPYAVAAFLLLALLAAPQGRLPGETGGDIYGAAPWPDPNLVVVRDRELALSTGRFSKEKQESLYFMSRFNGGWVFMASLFMSDAWFFDRWGVYALVTDPDGRSWWYTAEIRKSSMAVDSDRLSVTDGRNLVEGDGTRIRVRLRFDGFSCDLAYRNLLPPWMAGDGTNRLNDDGSIFERWILVSPWAEVEGSMTIDGKAVAVKGQGYVDRCLSVGTLLRTNPRFQSLRLYSPEGTPDPDRWHLGLLDTVSHPDFGSRRIPVLLLSKGGRWIFSSHSYSLTQGPMHATPGGASGYPETLRISAREEGFSLEGEFASRVLFNQTDIFADFPPFIADILRLLIRRPVFFRTLGGFRGRLVRPDGSVTELDLSGPYEYIAMQ